MAWNPFKKQNKNIMAETVEDEKAKDLTIIVTKRDIDMNPELTEEGIEVGDKITIEAASITEVEDEKKVSAPTLDKKLVKEFVKNLESAPQNKNTILMAASRTFGASVRVLEGDFQHQVYVVVGEERIPKKGFFALDPSL